MIPLLADRAKQIRECFVLEDGDRPYEDLVLVIDMPQLLELLRQASEADWDAGYDCGRDDVSPDDQAPAPRSLNPWVPK